jgi:murein L,D-transpeptidase YcbB/YkuD
MVEKVNAYRKLTDSSLPELHYSADASFFANKLLARKESYHGHACPMEMGNDWLSFIEPHLSWEYCKSLPTGYVSYKEAMKSSHCFRDRRNMKKELDTKENLSQGDITSSDDFNDLP